MRQDLLRRAFVQKDENLLWVSLAGKYFGKRPSELLQLTESDTVALDFDLTCAYRLTEYYNKRDHTRLESLIKSQTLMLGSILGADMNELRASLLSENDSETAENVEYW